MHSKAIDYTKKEILTLQEKPRFNLRECAHTQGMNGFYLVTSNYK